jgi:hypothetical protein
VFVFYLITDTGITKQSDIHNSSRLGSSTDLQMFLALTVPYQHLSYASVSGDVVADITVAASLCILLARSRIGWKKYCTSTTVSLGLTNDVPQGRFCRQYTDDIRYKHR